MKGILPTSFAVLILSIPHILAALLITWPSYTNQILESQDSPIGVPLTSTQLDMVASLPILGCLVSVGTWLLPDLVGRKKTVFLSMLVMALGWSVIATAKNVLQLLAARFLLGFGFGIHLIVCAIYINEISQAFIRGTLACIPVFFYSSGTLVSYIMGWFCSYHFIIYANLVLSVVGAVLASFLKESPVFLLTKGKDKDALKSLKFYRGKSKTSPELLEELEYLKTQRDASSYDPAAQEETPEKTKLQNEKGEDKSSTEMSAWKLLKSSKAMQRALVTTSSFVVLSMLMGILAIMTYAGQFFRIAAPDISPHLCSVIMAVAIAVGNGLGVVITDLVSRRVSARYAISYDDDQVLMLTSCSTCALCLGALWTMLRWSWAPTWAVPLCMLLHSCAYNVGAGILPMVQLSESFTPKVKVLASAIFTTSMSIANFILVSMFAPAAELLGLDGVFLLFFLITAFFTVLAFFIMKETRKVPLEDILGMYERGFLYWK